MEGNGGVSPPIHLQSGQKYIEIDCTSASSDDPSFTFEPFFKVNIKDIILSLGFSLIGAVTIWPFFSYLTSRSLA